MSKKHKWQFAARFRTCAFGWRASRLAAQRLKEAASEIRKAGRSDLVLAAEGAIKLIERLWPALQQIDTSSGLLGGAVNSAVHEVIQYPIEAQADLKTREKWLDRLWEAFQEDGVDYTMEVSDRWGELCGPDELRQKWLEQLRPTLEASWFTGGGPSYFRGESACLSCLLELGRCQELLDLLKRHSSCLWDTQRFGIKALVALGRPDEALDYAERLRGPYSNDWVIDQECEAILLSIGKRQEAYSRYGVSANRRGTGVATFRALSEKYPGKTESGLVECSFPSRIDGASLRIQIVCVRIIKEAFLVQAGKLHPKTAGYLEAWRRVVRAAEWRSLAEVRRTYPNADSVRVKSGRQVLVFNVCGNDFRLVVAAHFNRQIIYTLLLMTHAEYSKDTWKDKL